MFTKPGAKKFQQVLDNFLKSGAVALEMEEKDWPKFHCVVIKND